MIVKMSYGKEEIPVELPDENVIWELYPNDLPPVEDEEKAIKDALENPIGTKRLRDLVRRGMKIVIIADDLTRPTPRKRIIPILLNELNEIGIPDEDITVLIALGTHRYMTEEEILENFGEEVVRRVRIINHEWKDEKNLIYLGETENGTPVTINRVAYEADFLIALGSIVPHCFAGFGGGAKMIQPGICGWDTTAATHLLLFEDDERVLEYSGTTKNKIMEEMRAVAKKAGLNFIVNVVFNSKKELVKVVAGDFVKAHDAGIEVSKEIFVREIEERADIVVADAHPTEIDLWQGGKPLTYARRAVKDGGTLIFLIPAPDGVSPTHPIVSEWAHLNYKEIKRRVREEEVEDKVGCSVLMLIKKATEGIDVIVVSDGLTKEIKEKFGFIHAENVEEALKIAFEKHGKNAKIGIIHHGGDVLPLYKG
jgi:nickel-dependent lactate racemase